MLVNVESEVPLSRRILGSLEGVRYDVGLQILEESLGHQRVNLADEAEAYVEVP